MQLGFSETVHSVRESSESSFDANSLAKPEVLRSKMTSHRHHQRKQTTVTSHWTTPTDPERSICQRIQVRIHYEIESRFGQIEYGHRCDVIPHSFINAE